MSNAQRKAPTMAEQLQPALTILRRRDLEARLKLSRSTIYEKINPDSPRYDATFPKPIRLGNGSAVGWIEDEVEIWLRGRIEASRKQG
jgi:prophage regulatory protein